MPTNGRVSGFADPPRPGAVASVLNSRTDSVREFFEVPQRYLAKPFAATIRASIVRELIGWPVDSSILDVGCGDGRLSLQFVGAGNRLTLVDLSAKMLELARANTPGETSGTVAYRQADFQALREEEEFDILLCMGVLAHVNSVASAIAKVARLLKPGGRCVLQLTDHDAPIAAFSLGFKSVRRRIWNPYGYSPNRTTLVSTLETVGRQRLHELEHRRYSVLLPGMGKLPNKWLLRYERLTLRSPWLSKLGSEVVLLCRKEL